MLINFFPAGISFDLHVSKRVNIFNLGYQSTPVAPLKSQHHLERIDEITLNEEAVPNEDTPSSVHSDVQYLEKVSYKSQSSKTRSSNWCLNFVLLLEYLYQFICENSYSNTQILPLLSFPFLFIVSSN